MPPEPAMGLNASTADLIAACPSRKYHRCFFRQLQHKYPVTQFQLPRMNHRCTTKPGTYALSAPSCTFPPAERTLMYTSGPRLRLCPPSLRPLFPSNPPVPLRCDSPAKEVNARAVLLLGVPSSPTATGSERRAAIRASWLRDEHVGRDVVICFLLSSHTPEPALSLLKAEHRKHGDLLLLDSPETPWLIQSPTKYSGHTKRGRGMPTFKQYAFFQYAAARHGPVPFVGKIDDDTAPNLRVLVPFLARLRCTEPAPFAFIGAINWAAFVPRSHEFGVRGDRCGFGWNLHAALTNFGASFGVRGTKGYIEACDTRGAVLPFPYGTGAGYIFSSALLRWVASSAEVTGWVSAAAGPSRETLQWQKFEDTSTGYFVSRAPRTVSYVDIGPLVHDVACHSEGERKRRGGATYRPPANVSIFVHNLKGPTAFAFAWEHMQSETRPYDHARCVTQVYRQGRPIPSSWRQADHPTTAGKHRARRKKFRGGRRGSSSQVPA